MDDEMLHLEKLRKKAATVLLRAIAVSALITITCLFFIDLYSSLLIGVVVGFLLAKVSGYGNCSKEYKGYFKSVFVEKPFRNAFDQVIYISDLGLQKEIIEQTDMMCFGNLYHSNDYVQGIYKNIKFERADVIIEDRTRHGEHLNTITYFKGRWIVFEFNKDFHFDLQIIGKNFYNAQIKNSFFNSREERRHCIETKDTCFNQIYTVFGQNYDEAFYILTPEFIDVLKNISPYMDAAFMLGFVDNQLHIAFNTEKDSMETAVLSSNERPAIAKEVQREIKAIISIIDGLNLDRDIYKS